MTQFSNDFIVVISALGGFVGAIYATVQVVKSRAKYVEQSQCTELHHEIRKLVDREVVKRSSDVKDIYRKISEEAAKLHEKTNEVSNRVSKIEGGLKL